MRVFTGPGEVPADWEPTVVTLGTFDGVHTGHRQLIRRMRRIAEAESAWSGHTVRTAAITFDPHPLELHRPEDPPSLITGVYERRRQLAAAQLDTVMLLEYCWALAELSPEEFIRRYVVEGLNAKVLVIGRDVRFGRGNAGDLRTLEGLGRKYGFDVVACDDWCAEESGPAAEGDASERPTAHEQRRLSSTWVREALRDGRVDDAARILGRAHSVLGHFCGAAPADGGLPSAPSQLSVLEGMLPGPGMYSCWISRPGSAPATGIALVMPSRDADGTLTVRPAGLQWEPEGVSLEAASAVRVEFAERLIPVGHGAGEGLGMACLTSVSLLEAHEQLVA